MTARTRSVLHWVLIAVLVVTTITFSSSSPVDTASAPTQPALPAPPRPTMHTDPLVDPEPLARSATLRATEVAGRTFHYCGNGSIDNPPTEISRVIVVMHGNDRAACATAAAAMAAGSGEERARTLVIAPWFPIRTDRIDPRTDLHWRFYSWSRGDWAENPDARISAYSVVDEILDRVRHVPTVVAGFSGGGQFVARYAAATTNEPLRFVITNPSSYLYMTPDRPGASPEELAACPEYNDYRYGLNKPNNYLANAGELNIARRFGEREIVYLLGDADNDPRSTSMDQSCAARVQGAHRFERGLRYWNYLPSVYGPRIHQHHRLQIVPRVSHNAYAMFQHPGAKKALYG